MRTTSGILLLLLLLWLPAVSARAAEDPEKWDRSCRREIEGYVRRLKSLADWCEKSEIENSAWTMRQRVLRWAPGEEKLLEALGYRRTPDGGWRKDETLRAKLRNAIEVDSSKITAGRDKKLKQARTAAMRRFSSLAKRATKAATGADADSWRERAEKAWRLAAELDPGCKAAHEALGSQKVDGRFVLRKWVPAIRARVAEREAGRARAARAFPPQEAEADPRLAHAGITAPGARCDQFFAHSQYGAVIAQRLAVWSRRTGADLAEVYGFPSPMCGGQTYSLLALKDVEAWKRGLVGGFGWTQEKADAVAEKGVYGQWAAGNVFLYYTGGDDGGTAAIDAGIQSIVRWVVWSSSLTQGGGEAWFGEAMALDVVFRLTGQAIATFVEDAGYRDSMRDTPEMNRWQAISRLAVERDDDIPLSALCRLSLNQLRTRHTAKAYTFLQFLRENDGPKAKAFVVAMMSGGMLAAIEKVYEISPEALDEQYAAWIRATYVLTGS